MNPCTQTGSTLQRDAAARAGGQRTLRARSPLARFRAIVRVAGMV